MAAVAAVNTASVQAGLGSVVEVTLVVAAVSLIVVAAVAVSAVGAAVAV